MSCSSRRTDVGIKEYVNVSITCVRSGTRHSVGPRDPPVPWMDPHRRPGPPASRPRGVPDLASRPRGRVDVPTGPPSTKSFEAIIVRTTKMVQIPSVSLFREGTLRLRKTFLSLHTHEGSPRSYTVPVTISLVPLTHDPSFGDLYFPPLVWADPGPPCPSSLEVPQRRLGAGNRCLGTTDGTGWNKGYRPLPPYPTYSSMITRFGRKVGVS